MKRGFLEFSCFLCSSFSLGRNGGEKQEKREKEEMGVSMCGFQRVESRNLTYLVYVLRSALR